MLLPISHIAPVYGDPLHAGVKGCTWKSNLGRQSRMPYGGAQSVIILSIIKDFLSMVFFMVLSINGKINP
jgi:hypothetical protein